MTEIPKVTQLPYVVLPKAFVEDICAKGDVRHYLNQPYLDLDGKVPVIVATNGHFLMACNVEIEGEVASGALNVEAIKRARKAQTEQGLMDPRLYFDGDMCGSGLAMFKRPDMHASKFPEWRKLIPKKKKKPDICFNATYLKAVQDSLQGGVKKGDLGVMLYLGRNREGKVDHKAAFLVEPMPCRYERDSVVTVVMPQRFD